MSPHMFILVLAINCTWIYAAGCVPLCIQNHIQGVSKVCTLPSSSIWLASLKVIIDTHPSSALRVVFQRLAAMQELFPDHSTIDEPLTLPPGPTPVSVLCTYYVYNILYIDANTLYIYMLSMFNTRVFNTIPSVFDTYVSETVAY